MGNDAGKRLSPKEVEDLTKQTSFTQSEIRRWSKKFHECSPSGKMTRSEFQRIYEDIFPNGDSKMFADHVFRTYDNDSNGYIDFQEFLCTLSISSRGTIDDKLRWAFNVYDMDNDGHVTKKEVLEIFTAIHKMRGGSLGMGQDPSHSGGCGGCRIVKPKDAVDKMFSELDKNNDEQLSDVEFMIGAKSSPTVLFWLGSSDNP